MLKLEKRKFYRVKKGQTLREISRAFGVAERVLIKTKALFSEVWEGQILRIPACCGNAYTARVGDSKALLCGSEENYREKNGTDALYLGMRVIL